MFCTKQSSSLRLLGRVYHGAAVCEPPGLVAASRFRLTQTPQLIGSIRGILGRKCAQCSSCLRNFADGSVVRPCWCIFTACVLLDGHGGGRGRKPEKGLCSKQKKHLQMQRSEDTSTVLLDLCGFCLPLFKLLLQASRAAGGLRPAGHGNTVQQRQLVSWKCESSFHAIYQ